MNAIERLRKELDEARAQAKGKRFSHFPEIFKHIESIKVRIAHLLNPKERTHE